MTSARRVRAQVVEMCRLLADRGWVANHDGNVTLRLGPDRFLATPTATAKRRVTEDMLIEVNSAGQRVSGTARPFGELGLHLGVYERRDDVAAVVHAHPPHATAIACSGQALIERPFIAEAVVSLGASIPKIPFCMPGPDARIEIMAVAGDVDAVLLDNHGVLAWGGDLEQAYLRLELVEHLSRIAILAQPLGGVRPLPESAIPPLLQARAKAGLGKAADKAHESQKPPSTAPAASPARTGRDELVRVIREELMRALGKDGKKGT